MPRDYENFKYNKKYRLKGKREFEALKGLTFDLPDCGMVFILGRSGSGKSTLLNILGGLDTFDGGDITFGGKSFKSFTQKDWDDYRNSCCGFVFQDYNLIPELNVEENIALALEMKGLNDFSPRVDKALKLVGLQGYAQRQTTQLSGGQKQRVAIARAIVKEPEIIFADEPTGALDETTERDIFNLLKELSRERLVVVVSHDREFACEFGDMIIELADGKIVSDSGAGFAAAGQPDVQWLRPKMPAGAAVKLGCSSFKHHPVRFAVTLILSVITFLMTGLALSASMRGYGEIIKDAMTAQGLGEGSLVMNGGEEYMSDDNERGQISRELGCAALGIMPIGGGDGNAEYIFYSLLPLEAAHADTETLQTFGYTVEGRLPESENEVAITKFSREVFEHTGHLSSEMLTYNGMQFTVSGIIDTHICADYELLKSASAGAISPPLLSILRRHELFGAQCNFCKCDYGGRFKEPA